MEDKEAEFGGKGGRTRAWKGLVESHLPIPSQGLCKFPIRNLVFRLHFRWKKKKKRTRTKKVRDEDLS